MDLKLKLLSTTLGLEYYKYPSFSEKLLRTRTCIDKMSQSADTGLLFVFPLFQSAPSPFR